MMAKPLSIHVTYGTQTFLCSATHRDFLDKVSQRYGLEKDEIQIFEIDKKMKNIIGVEKLKDFMKVEIKKKVALSRINGNSVPPDETSNSLEDRIRQRLLDNRVLTGKERAFLLECLNNNSSNPRKRKDENDVNQPAKPEMRNRKVQVVSANLIALRTTYTQTDELINYEPLNTSKINNDIIIQSKKLAAAEKLDLAAATDLMAKTFDKRRNFIIMEKPVVSFVKEKYPLLFSCTEVQNELDRIFYDGKCQEFISNVEKYAPHILSMARDDDPLLLLTLQKMEEYQTHPQKKYAQEVGALLMVSSLMNEERSYLKLIDHAQDTSYFPCIDCQTKLKDIFRDQHLFKIYAEGHFLCEAPDFKEAVLCLIASYFIFNIKYPDVCFGTLVVFEKLFLEANDTDENEIEISTLQIIRSIQLKWQAKAS